MDPASTPPSPLKRPVLTLLSGSSLALALSYLAQPLLTRLYTPEAFGVLDAFVALASLLFVGSSLRYEDALLLPRNEPEARGLLRLSFYILTGLSLLCLLLSLPARWLLQHRTALADWLPWLAPALLLMGSGRLAELWLMRQQAFRVLSAGTALRSTATTLLRLAAGLPSLQAGAAGLIGGFLGGHLSTLLLYGWHLHRQEAPAMPSASPALTALAYRYRRFPLFTFPAALLNALSMRLPFLLLLAFFDAQVLGFFGRAFMVLTVPLGLVGGAASQVFFVRAAEVRYHNELATLTLRVYRRLLYIGLYPVLLLIMMGPDLFAFVFGAPWRLAGQYAAWIAPWLLLAGLVSPLSRLFDVLERQRADFATSVLLFLLQTSALIIGGLQGRPDTTLILLGVAGVLGRLVQLGVLLHLAGIPIRWALAPLLRYGLYSLPLLGLLYLTASWTNAPIHLGLALLSVLCYLGLGIWIERRLPASTR